TGCCCGAGFCCAGCCCGCCWCFSGAGAGVGGADWVVFVFNFENVICDIASLRINPNKSTASKTKTASPDTPKKIHFLEPEALGAATGSGVVCGFGSGVMLSGLTVAAMTGIWVSAVGGFFAEDVSGLIVVGEGGVTAGPGFGVGVPLRGKGV